MPSLRYLNSMLTIIAVLLTLNVYAMWTAAPAHVTAPADAYAAEPAGLPNAGKQRKDMIDELKKVNGNIDALKSALLSGKVKVQVEGDAKSD